jgi:ATP-binding protein involved in chromosome partitioning
VSLTKDAVMTALATVQDPEIRRPITEIGMVKNVEVSNKDVLVEIYLTVSGCPLNYVAQLKKIPLLLIKI